MTDQEKITLQKSADLWLEFLKLPSYHDDDIKDVRTHIHAIQNIIAARKAIREHTEIFKQPQE